MKRACLIRIEVRGSESLIIRYDFILGLIMWAGSVRFIIPKSSNTIKVKNDGDKAVFL